MTTDNDKPISGRQKRFAEEYCVDQNGAQAAIRAGYSKRTANEQAARLLANASVKERVDELFAEHRKRMEVTVDSLTAFLLDDRNLAHENKQAGAAVSASEKLGKLHGLLSDRLKIDVRVAPADLTDAEIEAELGEIEREMVHLWGRAGIVDRIAKLQRWLVKIDEGEFNQPAAATAPAPLALPAPVTPPP